MKPQIIVYNQQGTKIGATYPKRAKQLVSNSKAKWLELHKAIEIFPFSATPEGGKAVDATGIARKRSIVLDAYRDDDKVILESSPLEIIRKSKRRTRMLHISFSAVLWTGTLIVFVIVNQLLGYTGFTLNPRDMAGTWLIFVIAAFIECAVEIFFSRKELTVLSENIDLRQINPANDDLDLRGYKKRLIRKIRIMSSAVIWIPLALLFFFNGYVFGNWGIVWIVFLFGVFFELLMHFIKRLRGR